MVCDIYTETFYYACIVFIGKSNYDESFLTLNFDTSFLFVEHEPHALEQPSLLSVLLKYCIRFHIANMKSINTIIF